MNQMGKGVTVGLDKVYYAIMTDETAETYDAPIAIPGAITANVTPTTNSATLFADDQADEVADSLGDIQLELNVKDLSTLVLADLLGHATDANGALVRTSEDVAPYVAIGYRRRKSNGQYRYNWIYKGKFRLETQEAATKTDTPTFQTPTISATFVPRSTDKKWQIVINSDDVGVNTATITNWFANVYLSSADITPPTVAVIPADDATGVAVGANIVWTFSKAIRAGLVNGANFMLMDDVFTPVAGTLSIDATNTIVTFNPTADLDAATAYTAMVTTGVKDLAGNALAAPSITTFTTA